MEPIIDRTLFFDYVQRYGLNNSDISIYNIYMDKILDLITGTNKFETAGVKWELEFRSARFEDVQHTPNECRENGLTYDMEIVAEAVISYHKGASGPRLETSDVRFGSIPIMMGSKYDITSKYGRGVSDYTMAEYGEDPDYPMSQFIVDGLERMFDKQDGLKYNSIRSYFKPNGDAFGAITELKTETRDGRTSWYAIGLDSDSIVRFITFREYDTQKTLNKKIPCLEMFRLYWSQLTGTPRYGQPISSYAEIKYEDITIEDFILQFATPNNRNRLRLALEPSIKLYLSSKETDTLDLLTQGSSVKSKVFNLDFFRSDIYDKWFNHLDNVLDKLALLSIMIIERLELKEGLRSSINRDSYSHKTINTAGSAIYRLFVIYFNEIMDNVVSTYNPGQPITVITSLFSEGSGFKKHIENSFKKSWGISKQKGMAAKKKYYVSDYKSGFYPAAWHSAMKISKEANPKAAKFSTRAVEGSQTGLVDASETPESEKIGLTNSKTIASELSIPFSETIIEDSLDDLQKDGIVIRQDFERTITHPTIILFNVMPIGKCNGDLAAERLKILRRLGIIHRTVMILHNAKHGYLYIDTSSGRLCRSLYVLRGDTPLFKLLPSIQPNIDSMIENGAIDIIDASEQEWSKICESEHKLNTLTSTKKKLESELGELDTIRNEIENGKEYYRGIRDPSKLLEPIEYGNELKRLKFEIQLNFETEKAKISDIETEIYQILQRGDNTDISTRIEMLKTRLNDAVGKAKKLNPPEANETYLTHKQQSPVTIADIERQKEIITSKLHELEKKLDYDYCEIDPMSIMGTSAGMIPFAQHDPGPRVTYECKMLKQSIGRPNSQIRWKFEAAKILVYPNRQIAESQLAPVLHMSNHAFGTSVILAILTTKGLSIEDNYVINKASIERGLGLNVVHKYISEKIELSSGISHAEYGRITYKIGGDITTVLGRTSQKARYPYRHLDERGIVRPHSILKIGDCVLGYYEERISGDQKHYIDKSIYVKRSKVGTVENILFDVIGGSYAILKIKITEVRFPGVGDKYATMHAQKGTTGAIIPHHLLPYSTKTGIVPDVFMNPHAIPSRMTVAQLIEMYTSKAAVFTGERVDATPFGHISMEYYQSILENNGFESTGKELFIDGSTGELIEANVFVGVCHFQSLEHQSNEKIQYRFRGKYKAITRQPVTGKDNEGGMRLGEMERDSLCAYGIISTLRQFFYDDSDGFTLYACAKCGDIITANHSGAFTCFRCKEATELYIIPRTAYVQEIVRYYNACLGVRMTYNYKPLTYKF